MKYKCLVCKKESVHRFVGIEDPDAEDRGEEVVLLDLTSDDVRARVLLDARCGDNDTQHAATHTAVYMCPLCTTYTFWPLPAPPMPYTAWVHKKGGRYEVLDVGWSSESLEPVVCYKSVEHGTIWIRPLIMWTVDRFTRG